MQNVIKTQAKIYDKANPQMVFYSNEHITYLKEETWPKVTQTLCYYKNCEPPKKCCKKPCCLCCLCFLFNNSCHKK